MPPPGKVVPPPEVVKWTVNNSQLPELGFLGFHAEEGFLTAVGASGYRTGIYGGVIGGEVLKGAAPAEIAIIDPKVVDVSFNLEREKMLGLNIPSDELAKATEVFKSIG